MGPSSAASSDSSEEEEVEQQKPQQRSDGPLELPESRLESIWDVHLEQYRRLDNLEKRIDEHAARLRRRIQNVLETTPTHRLSHLRLFVSHHGRSPATNARLLQEVSSNAAAASSQAVAGTTPNPAAAAAAAADNKKKWTLVIEGKLLVGHLDHASAKEFDERLKREFQERHKVSSADHSSLAVATSVNTSNATPTEEEPPVDAIQFTHFFDKLVVQFQSVYLPDVQMPAGTNSSAAATGAAQSTPKAASTPKESGGGSSSSKKKSRSAKRQKTSEKEVDVPEQVDPRLLTYSDPTEFVWNKTVTTLTGPTPSVDNRTPTRPGGVTTTQTTPDAHAFYVHYDSPPPPATSMKLYGAIATAQLYPTRGPEQRYKPSKDFAKAFFPKHVDAVTPPVLPTVAIAEAKKAEEDEAAGETNTPPKQQKRKANNNAPAYQTAPNALDNEIHVPISLTMQEIIMSLFTYIQDKKLTSEEDPTLIQNDKNLESLFQCETMHFHEIQTLLMQRKLILLLPKPAPITLKYVMLDTPKEDDDEEEHQDQAAEEITAPMSMDLHNDVYVPNLFPSRARECLRRIKRRELDYTSNRTKARYLLLASKAKEDSVVKTKLEEAICGSVMGEWPALACLAKAAPPHSEARITAMLDAKIAYLLQQVEQSQEKAQQAWDLVDLCRNMADCMEDDDTARKDSKESKKPETNNKEQGKDAMDIDKGSSAAADLESSKDAEETDI